MLASITDCSHLRTGPERPDRGLAYLNPGRGAGVFALAMARPKHIPTTTHGHINRGGRRRSVTDGPLSPRISRRLRTVLTLKPTKVYKINREQSGDVERNGRIMNAPATTTPLLTVSHLTCHEGLGKSSHCSPRGFTHSSQNGWRGGKHKALPSTCCKARNAHSVQWPAPCGLRHKTFLL